ncbi:prepilin peptidase [Prochlorococcus marinus]|uniref:prepilin peptidase n=1 Tax=Prochlorococcus marinus TaxID=1219 RepID=UPI0022B4F0D7|nr:A24 family peptidase [Prochlorococcus marinus]
MNLFFLGVFGLCVGSFLNVILYRMPKNESIVKPRSACPSCKTKLSFIELIPVISWLIQLGKCRHCKAKISITYPSIEIITSVLFIMAIFSKPTIQIIDNQLILIIAGCMLYSIIIILTIFDIKFFWLPDTLTFLGISIGIFINILPSIIYLDYNKLITPLSYLFYSISAYFIIAFVAFLLKKILNKPAMGLGDAKLSAMVSSWLGLEGLELVLMLTILTSGLYSTLGLLLGVYKRGSVIPLGSFICLSFGAVWFLGNNFFLDILDRFLWWRYL